ncbi:MAG TPA: hypothetical protein VKX49_24530 [Bryobacteraceae bacterium]|nr:hypothetical protein [Bryobacteraceae bacterium]
MPASTWKSAALAFALLSGPCAGLYAQTLRPSGNINPASPGWPFGPPHHRVTLEGILAHADSEMVSVALPDERIIRFRVDHRTQYKTGAASQELAAFHVTDVVSIDSEVDGKGYLVAKSIRFVRNSSPEERGRVLHSPELLQDWTENLLRPDQSTGASAADDRRLSSVDKPNPIFDRPENGPSLQRADYRGESHRGTGNSTDSDLIPFVRRKVNEAFESLPSLRAREVTSLFHSTSNPVKWIPDNVVSAEIAYEEDRESYSDIQIDGKRPADAPDTGTSDYMRSMDKAWSTGDFETIAHCIFSDLQDADFHLVGTEHNQPDVSIYKFEGGRNSTCLGLKFRSEIAYPAYKGLMKVRRQTHEVLHVELEAVDVPEAFPLDRAERSIDFGTVQIGNNQYLLPATGYWFGCFRNSYSCFLNRIDFRDYRRFEADSRVEFGK